MKALNDRLGCFMVLCVLALVSAGCGGSGSGPNPPPPPPSGKFSNASLSGQYAFSMTGQELCPDSNNNLQSSIFMRAGSFTADGNGHITTGLEDVNVCVGTGTLQFTGGTYSIGGDGRGTLQLINSTGATNYSVVLSTTSDGVIVQADTQVTARGSFQRQNTATFSNAATAGGYVFDASGVDVSGNPLANHPASFIGRFDADGAGGVTNGLYDSNIDGTASGQLNFPTGAFLQLDTNGDGTTFGRGTANIAGLSFAYYIVDGTRLKLVGTDFPSGYGGEAFAQQNIAFTISSVNGSFAFGINGYSTNGPIASAGRFTADGAGNVSNVVSDENNNGGLTLLPSGTVTGTYTVDSNQFGGGTVTWTDSQVGTFSFIFYLISPTQAVFQEVDSNIVSDGKFSAQTATPISASSLAGDYALNWTDFFGDEEDYAGQVTLSSSGSVSGALDFNQFSNGPILFDVPVSGTLTVSGNGTQANTLAVNLAISPALSLHFTAYVLDQNTILLIGTDTVTNSTRVIFGKLIRQP